MNIQSEGDQSSSSEFIPGAEVEMRQDLIPVEEPSYESNLCCNFTES